MTSVNMRSHIYLTNRRAAAFVTTAGQPEVLAGRQNAYLRHKSQQHHKRQVRRASARRRQHRRRHEQLLRPGSHVDLQPVDREGARRPRRVPSITAFLPSVTDQPSCNDRAGRTRGPLTGTGTGGGQPRPRFGPYSACSSAESAPDCCCGRDQATRTRSIAVCVLLTLHALVGRKSRASVDDRRIMSPACWRIPTAVSTCVNARLITATGGDLAASLPSS